MTILLANTYTFEHFSGTLDDTGIGSASLNLESGHGYPELLMHFSFALSSPWDFVSNPVIVEIVP
jgi:hypothetical protein